MMVVMPVVMVVMPVMMVVMVAVVVPMLVCLSYIVFGCQRFHKSLSVSLVRLLEITPHDGNDFLRRLLLFRVRFVFRVKNVETDMPFDDFRHQRIHRAATRGQRQQDG